MIYNIISKCIHRPQYVFMFYVRNYTINNINLKNGKYNVILLHTLFFTSFITYIICIILPIISFFTLLFAVVLNIRRIPSLENKMSLF